MKISKHTEKNATLLVVMLVVGVLLLLYPAASNHWNLRHATQAITGYSNEIADMDSETHEKLVTAAQNYNSRLAADTNSFWLSDEQEAEYNQLLNISGIGTMGYLEIPSINVELPIYHGVGEEVLQVAVGHLPWSSLPVGGSSSHCVLSGHRGLPSAKLLTHLDKLSEDDVFILNVLNQKLTYQVDQILIVEPEDTEDLQIIPGEDLCTLVTCTPYGINTQRLLVRGRRIANIDDTASRLTADAIQIEPLLVAPIIAAPPLVLLLTVLVLPRKPRQENNQ